MTEENESYEPQDTLNLSKEIEDTIHNIILACGARPLKEKVSLLFLSIDYIYAHNNHLIPLLTDTVSLH
jgi:hypothetical protein